MNGSDIFDAYSGPLHEPLEYIEDSPGALFTPLTGLSCDRQDVQIGNLRLIKILPGDWRMIEKDWIIDLYLDYFTASPRYYAAIPVDSAEAMNADIDGYLNRTLAPVSELVLAMRLAAPGFVVDPHYSTPVLRINYMNHRAVGRERYRLYGIAFGDDLVLPAKTRRVGDRTIIYPERVIPSSGPALQLKDEIVPTVERMLALYKAYTAGPPNTAVEIAIRNLTRGHDIFLTFTERLLCLITALEAVLGPFGDGRLESRLTQTYLIFRGKADRTTARIEPELRRVRNAVAHGADYRRDLDYKGVSELLRDVLRIGLPPLIRLATSSGARALELATEEGDEGLPPPSIAFQRLLDRSVAGDQESRRALVELR